MNKGYLFVLPFLFLVNSFCGEIQLVKEKTIPDLIRPRYMGISEDTVYIVEDKVKVTGYSIYNLEKNVQLNTRKGQGPNEFGWAPGVLVNNEYIYLKSTKKVVKFSKIGKALEIFTLKGTGVPIPIYENYIFWYFFYDKKSKHNYTIVDLINKKNKRLKRVYTYKNINFRPPYMTSTRKGKGVVNIDVSEYLNIQVSNNKVYILIPAKQMVLKIFNSQGKEIEQIKNIKIPEVIVTQKEKNNLMEKFKYNNGISDKEWKTYSKRYNFIFPKKLQRVQNIVIDKENLYIKTNQQNSSKTNFVVYNLKNKKQHSVYLPDGKLWKIKKNYLYNLNFSEKADDWVLSCYKLP